MPPQGGPISTFVAALVYAFALSLASPAGAEYRAYRHKISGIKGSRSVVSTLDPAQYADQYLAGQWDSVILEQTWMCYGRTSDFAPICPPSPDEGEASTLPAAAAK